MRKKLKKNSIDPPLAPRLIRRLRPMNKGRLAGFGLMAAKVAVDGKRERQKNLEQRVIKAASVYDPSANQKRSNSLRSPKKMSLLDKMRKNKGRRSRGGGGSSGGGVRSGGGSGGSGRKGAEPKTAMSAEDKHAVQRYKLLQDDSHTYMNLVETEARKLLEVQQLVLQASMHLEHIRGQHGGYTTPSSVLNSGERGSKEAVAREKAFFKQHVANLESEVVAANTLASKEVILQGQIRAKVNQQRRTICGKKETILRISRELQTTKHSIQRIRGDAKFMRDQCTKEKTRIDRIAVREKKMMNAIAKKIFKVEQQRRAAITRHRMEMTSNKQEVERKRRAANLEALATKPTKGGRQLRPSTAANGAAARSRIARRPTTAPKRNAKNFINPATVKKSERSFRSNARKIRKQKAAHLHIHKHGQVGYDEDTDDEDYADVRPLSSAERAKSPPPDLRPDFSDNPDALEDPATNPRKWLPGRPQKRTDLQADRSPASAKVPPPLGRRGMLVGRAPGRFPNGKLEGRVELLLAHLPEVSQKLQSTKKRSVATSWQLARNKMADQDIGQDIDTLEKTFDKIKEKSGIQTIEEFSEKFLESETRQFEMVRQIEDMEQHLSNIHGNCRALAADKAALESKNSEKSHVGLFTKIKDEIKSLRNQCASHKRMLAKNHVHIQGCIASIEGLLHAVDTSVAREVSGVNAEQTLYLEELVEGHGGVNEVVLPQFLGSIEERVLQLLQVHEIMEEKARQGRVQSRPGSRFSNHTDVSESKKAFISSFGTDRPTTFGESALESRRTSTVGGNLPVEEQVRRKFAKSPKWMLKMAVDMRDEHATQKAVDKNASVDDGGALSEESAISSSSSSSSSDSNSDEKENGDDDDGAASDATVDSLFGEDFDDEETKKKKKLEKAEKRRQKVEERRRKMENKKKKKKKKRRQTQVANARVQAYVAVNKLSIVMPREEELETSNSDLSDDADGNGGGSLVAVRPVSKQMMRDRAARLQGRRDEIRAFLGMNQAKRRGLVAFSKFVKCCVVVVSGVCGRNFIWAR